MGLEEGAIGSPAGYVEVALTETDSAIWVVDLDTETIQTQLGLVTDLFNFDITEPDRFEVVLEQVVHPEDLPMVTSDYQHILHDDQERCQVECRTNPAHGEVRWIESHARVKQTADGRVLVGKSTDITAQKRREQELKNQSDRLEQFASVLSHDLRNPLQVATGHVELAQEQSNIDHLDTVGRMLDQMEALTEDLLSSLESGAPVIRGGDTTQTVEATELATVATTSWGAITTDDATLQIETEQTIRAEQASLQQLLENLFANAVEHGGPDVTVTVGALEAESGFYVADDGPGIPETDRSRIFEPGYSTADTGTGLGLHIVKKIVDTLEWEIRVTDSAAGGARFEVTGMSSR